VHLANYLGALERGEATLGAAFEVVGQGHARDAGVPTTAGTASAW
jgi:hypothetical protein